MSEPQGGTWRLVGGLLAECRAGQRPPEGDREGPAMGPWGDGPPESETLLEGEARSNHGLAAARASSTYVALQHSGRSMAGHDL